MKKSLLLLSLFSITALAQIPVPGYLPANGLQAWYPFSGNANDESGNTHHGTSNGAVLTTDRFGNPNTAYMFGTGNYISVSDNVNFRPQNFSISAWCSFTSTPVGYHMILAKNVGSGSPESIDMNFSVNEGGWLCNIGDIATLGPFVVTSYSPSVGAWYHIVYQFDDINNTQKIYLNGALTASGVVNMSVGYDTKPWTIGMEYESNVPGFYFNGKIDDIGIWNRILTPAEIQQVYCATSINSQPVSQTVTLNSSVSFSVACTNPTVTLQWQTDTGAGFSNVVNGGQYSGANSATLLVSNTTLSNNNQFFRCIASASCATVTSNSAMLTVNDVNGVRSYSSDSRIRIFPNPVKDELHVTLESCLNCQTEFTITDVSGKILKGGFLHNDSDISLNGLSPGIYFLRIGRTSFCRLVKE